MRGGSRGHRQCWNILAKCAGVSGWGREDLRRDNANHGAPAEAGAAEVEERQVESVRAPLDLGEYSCLLIRQSRWQRLALLL